MQFQLQPSFASETRFVQSDEQSSSYQHAFQSRSTRIVTRVMSVTQTLTQLLEPWQFMLASLSYLPDTISRLYSTTGLFSIFSWHTLQKAWFSTFWAWAGPRIRESNGPRIIALLEGRVTGAQVVSEAVVEPISGVVLDIGPGLGYWVDVYAQTEVPVQDSNGAVQRRGRAGKGITKVYGVEPNSDAHAGLRQRVADAGLDGVYEILPVGIEDIAKETVVEKGSVDAIVSLLCLCSIPEPEKNIRELHSYLKPGGRWYVYEHVVVKGYWPMQVYQRFVNLFWPHVLSGCQLCRDTGKMLHEAGEWTKIDLEQPPTEPWNMTVPHIFGTLVK